MRTAGLLSGWSLEAPACPQADSLWHCDGLRPLQDLGVELLGSLVVQALVERYELGALERG
ncbi:hypothetical protein AB0H00_28935 [Nocardia sp. NPDC023852]|uniref:hypothetical protein n=1 Tax=Nocardia sp. NPDC023852 TaxID=3154697 RepID=UPI0033D2E754